jgi:hypothetical protein
MTDDPHRCGGSLFFAAYSREAKSSTTTTLAGAFQGDCQCRRNLIRLRILKTNEPGTPPGYDAFLAAYQARGFSDDPDSLDGYTVGYHDALAKTYRPSPPRLISCLAIINRKSGSKDNRFSSDATAPPERRVYAQRLEAAVK